MTDSSAMTFRIPDLPKIFADLDPVPQDDGPVAVCQIDYPIPFVQAFDYFRAVLKKQEYSSRSLHLSFLCLELNPANYTVWHFRRQCLQAMEEWSESRLLSDLTMTAQLGGENPKNYQIWYHRRAMIEKFKANGGNLQDQADAELRYIASVLQVDGKNYHAWSHRQWLIQAIDSESLWKAEIEYASQLIDEDVRNNSAWNQRWFASHRAQRKPHSLQVARKEADYAIKKVKLDPYNESSFRYLMATIKEQIKDNKLASQSVALIQEYDEKILTVKNVLKEAGRDPEGCPNLNSARVDLLEWKADESSLEEAVVLLQDLAEKHDPIRCKYWDLRIAQIKSMRS